MHARRALASSFGVACAAAAAEFVPRCSRDSDRLSNPQRHGYHCKRALMCSTATPASAQGGHHPHIPRSVTEHKLLIDRECIIQKNSSNIFKEYEPEGELGQGGYSKVIRARHRRSGTERAIKRVFAKGTDAATFHQELQMLMTLDSPHVIRLIEYFEEDKGDFFLVEELGTGPDLYTFMSKHYRPGGVPISERDISVIMRQCLKAVLHCHACGVVHRDIKPENFVLSDRDMSVKLIDLGVAVRAAAKDTLHEKVGTVEYMAPEVALDKGYGTEADVWSLGMLFWVLLTGRSLLPSCPKHRRLALEDPTYVEDIVDIASCLRKRNASKAAIDLLKRMLRYDPQDRISVEEALSHPFIAAHVHDGLQPGNVEVSTELQEHLGDNLHSFAFQPRLKKLALLIMSHLSSIQTRHADELFQAAHVFRTMDINGDGEISFDELKTGLEKHGVKASKDLEEVFAVCDANSSGTLNYWEFLASALPSSFFDEDLCSEAFNVLDKDQSGSLSASGIWQAVLRFRYTVEECEEILAEALSQGCQGLSREDFIAYMVREVDLSAGEF